MWRRRITQRALAATRLTMTSQHRRETRKSRPDRSISLRSKNPSGGAASGGVIFHDKKEVLSKSEGGGRRRRDRSYRVGSIWEGQLIYFIQ